jgi:hypothetical protein
MAHGRQRYRPPLYHTPPAHSSRDTPEDPEEIFRYGWPEYDKGTMFAETVPHVATPRPKPGREDEGIAIPFRYEGGPCQAELHVRGFIICFFF